MNEVVKNNELAEVILPNETLLIRQLSPSDAKAYFNLIDGDRDHFSKFDDGNKFTYKSIGDVIEVINNTSPNRFRFGVWNKDELIGGATLGVQGDVGEVGFWIGADYTGNRYGSMALEALMLFGFNHLNKSKLLAHVLIGNYASCKTLEGVGFLNTKEDDGYMVYEMKREDYGG